MSNVVVPQLGESVVEARIVKWLKNEGDSVKAGEPVVELETDKVDMEIPADHAGTLTSITRKAGEDVKVGDVIAVIDVGGEQRGKPETRATPTAKRIAQDHDLDLGAAPRSGSQGRVMKQDVEQVISKAKPAPAPSGEREERVRMSKRRLTIARRLVEAQHTAAMLTTFNEVDMTAIVDIRNTHQDAFKERYGAGLGITPFFVKAAVAALRLFPQINAEIQGEEMVLKRYYDIGIAVGAEGGLVVPVLRDADQMSFGQIEKTIREFAARANDGSLTLEDLKGGTFTITYGGAFGSLFSTPILNPPQVGILGLHKISERAVVVDGKVVIRPMMYVALSYDHRIVDGREAVQFLAKVKEFAEDPGHLLVEG